jgi:hypothetical protein
MQEATMVKDAGSKPVAGPRSGWLEIFTEPGTAEAHAYCPYRERMLRVAECFACTECAGLAMDGRGEHSYVVCARAEGDGIATMACAEPGDGGVTRCGSTYARVITVPPLPDDEA